jgi:hypothetical protein
MEAPRGEAHRPMPLCRALTGLKGRRVGAKKGFELLKRKSDALMVRFRRMLGIIIEVGLSPVTVTLCTTVEHEVGPSSTLTCGVPADQG